MRIDFFDYKYRKAKTQIKSIIKKGRVSGVININSDDKHLIELLKQEGYMLEILSENSVYVSCKNAIKGKALKDKQKVMRMQYVYLMNLIEYQRSRGKKSLCVYSMNMYILHDIINLFKSLGYIITETVYEIDDEQFLKFEIKWR